MTYEGSDMTEFECEAILDWWLDIYPEYSDMIENALDVLVYGVKYQNQPVKPVMFARSQAAMIIYRLIEKGYLPCK